MDRLYESMYRLLAKTSVDFCRYTNSQINWDNQMLGVTGPRGVGKTTLFLQKIKQNNDERALYFSMDDMYFADHTMFETAEAFVKDEGRYLFIDEVHKYPNWSRELKAIYDSFPTIHVYFTGSSILDIEKGEADLSRRAPIYHMQGLSFREYLNIRHGIEAPVFTLEEILENKAEVPGLDHPLPSFKEYLKYGYYPFSSDPDFYMKLDQIINRTLEVDIPQFTKMNASTGQKLKMLMAVVSTSAPFKPNMSNIAGKINVSRNNVEDYLRYMEKAGMVAQLATSAGGLGALGKTEKVYLDNTNLIYDLGNGHEDIGAIRETFFFNQMRVNNRVLASRISDFKIDDIDFEVGGKNKGKDQLKGSSRGYVVKDDLEFGHGNTIPLWAFGLNY